MKIPYDVVGDIAMLKCPFDMKAGDKKKVGRDFLKEHKNINTVLEKVGKFSGRLRKPKTKFLAGENKKETIHKENGCRFFLNVDETYFSPRLSNERKIVAEEILRKILLVKGSAHPTHDSLLSCQKQNLSKANLSLTQADASGLSISGKFTNQKYSKIGEPKASLKCRRQVPKILVMFAGVAPFSIVIAERLKKSGKYAEIISSEINKKASAFAEKNVRLNKLGNYISVVAGNSKKLSEKLKNYKADFIVMPRPNLKETFLETALGMSKKGTMIYYYGFGGCDDVLDEIKRDAGGKIGKIKIRRAGEIGAGQFRWLASFEVLTN